MVDDILVMDRDGHVRTDQLDQLQTLFGVHGEHEEGQRREWNAGATQVDQHQVDVLALVVLRDGFEVVHHQGVAGDVNSIAVTCERESVKGKKAVTYR